MKINWGVLLFATALLWFPRSWMRRGLRVGSGRKRHGLGNTWTNPPQDGSSLAFRREFRKSRNFYDLLRSAVAGVALAGGFGVAAAVAPIENANKTVAIVAVQAGVAVVGLLIQTIRYERRRISLAAPAFYLAGLAIAFCGPWAGLCGFAVAWAASPIAPNAQGFLTIQAIVSVAFGVLFHGVDLLLLVGGALCFAPVLLSMLVRRPLIVFSRRASSEARSFSG